MERSEIEEFFKGAHVFLTGATGFLGTLVMEKLLRSCSDLDKLYVLIRVKKGKAIEDRVEELFENAVFDRLKKEHPNFLSKVVLIAGDCSQPDLGLSEEDRVRLRANVNCILHFAATVRFDQSIRAATYINVRATRDLLRLAKESPKLSSFVYVSTAFSHCVRSDIAEEFYEPPITGERLMTLVDACSEEFLNKITPTLLGDCPNTYTFTKAVAEEVVQSLGQGLPIAIVRPSINLPTAREPMVGWVANMFGISGLIAGTAVGLIRVIYCKKTCGCDLVPADYAINNAIAVAWYAASRPQKSDVQPLIFNCVASPQSPLTWEQWQAKVIRHLMEIPSTRTVWWPITVFEGNYYVYMLLNILLHHIPAYVVDFLALCLGKERQCVNGVKKIDKVMNALSYFTTREWKFSNRNNQELFQRLNPTDRERFFFDLKEFNWDTFLYTVGRGARVYILNDPLETIPEGIKHFRKLRIAHWTLVTLICVGVLLMCNFVLKFFFDF